MGSSGLLLSYIKLANTSVFRLLRNILRHNKLSELHKKDTQRKVSIFINKNYCCDQKLFNQLKNKISRKVRYKGFLGEYILPVTAADYIFWYHIKISNSISLIIRFFGPSLFRPLCSRSLTITLILTINLESSLAHWNVKFFLTY